VQKLETNSLDFFASKRSFLSPSPNTTTSRTTQPRRAANKRKSEGSALSSSLSLSQPPPKRRAVSLDSNGLKPSEKVADPRQVKSAPVTPAEVRRNEGEKEAVTEDVATQLEEEREKEKEMGTKTEKGKGKEKEGKKGRGTTERKDMRRSRDMADQDDDDELQVDDRNDEEDHQEEEDEEEEEILKIDEDDEDEEEKEKESVPKVTGKRKKPEVAPPPPKRQSKRQSLKRAKEEEAKEEEEEPKKEVAKKGKVGRPRKVVKEEVEEEAPIKATPTRKNAKKVKEEGDDSGAVGRDISAFNEESVKTWSAARLTCWIQRRKNANAFYYRFTGMHNLPYIVVLKFKCSFPFSVWKFKITNISFLL